MTPAWIVCRPTSATATRKLVEPYLSVADPQRPSSPRVVGEKRSSNRPNAKRTRCGGSARRNPADGQIKAGTRRRVRGRLAAETPRPPPPPAGGRRVRDQSNGCAPFEVGSGVGLRRRRRTDGDTVNDEFRIISLLPMLRRWPKCLKTILDFARSGRSMGTRKSRRSVHSLRGTRAACGRRNARIIIKMKHVTDANASARMP
jgi:hypothetical protein